MKGNMMQNDFLPIILGSDENAYGTARLFNEAYGIKPLLLCTRQLIPTLYSRLFKLEIIKDFDLDTVFPDALLAVLKRESENYGKIIVVSCSDYYTALLSKHYDHFEGLIANKFISPSLLDALDTKDKFYALCENYGLDYPKTYVVECGEREEAAEKFPFDYPIVVKPENSNASDYLHCSFEGKKKVFYFDSKDEYLTVVRAMNQSDYRGKLIVQEFIPGGDESMRVVNTYSDDNGKVRAICLGQPVLEEYAPKTLGNYAAIISRYDETVMRKIKDFLENIGYVGFANFDMKYDIRSGRYMLFEINPRLGRSSFFVHAAGFNMMRVLVDNAVYSKENECVFVNKTALWSNVPKIVLKKYIADPALRLEITGLIKQKKYERTLVCKGDMNLKRKFWIMRYYFGQYRNFVRYYFDKADKDLKYGKNK